MSCDHNNLPRLHYIGSILMYVVLRYYSILSLVKTQQEYTCIHICTVHTVVVRYSELFQNILSVTTIQVFIFFTFSLFRDIVDP